MGELTRCGYRINDLGGRCQQLKGHDSGVHEVEGEVRRRVAEALAPRRADDEFMERITRRAREDAPLMERMAAGPPTVLQASLDTLPLGLFVGANRYDTDDCHVLHLWTAAGVSYDVIWPKADAPTTKNGSYSATEETT